MNNQFNDSIAGVQSKLKSAKTLCLDLRVPQPEILRICDGIGHKYRDRILQISAL
ncbi:hypothetical protein [Neorhodopirellula lusitana]|uniref:hypothetical protein n=1 Tax=Neorhodopirellula lusitana TaxID=445327 RepID=UPI0024B7195E|nr:hypothetical protein [Neorhodopirellula lusitana]